MDGLIGTVRQHKHITIALAAQQTGHPDLIHSPDLSSIWAHTRENLWIRKHPRIFMKT